MLEGRDSPPLPQLCRAVHKELEYVGGASKQSMSQPLVRGMSCLLCWPRPPPQPRPPLPSTLPTQKRLHAPTHPSTHLAHHLRQPHRRRRGPQPHPGHADCGGRGRGSQRERQAQPPQHPAGGKELEAEDEESGGAVDGGEPGGAAGCAGRGAGAAMRAQDEGPVSNGSVCTGSWQLPGALLLLLQPMGRGRPARQRMRWCPAGRTGTLGPRTCICHGGHRQALLEVVEGADDVIKHQVAADVLEVGRGPAQSTKGGTLELSSREQQMLPGGAPGPAVGGMAGSVGWW